MSQLLQPGQHPDGDQLNAFVERALPAHEYQQTLAHLAGCPDCRTVVALSLPPVEDAPPVEAESTPRSWFSGWNLAWPVAAAASIALAILVVQVHKAATSAGTVTQMVQGNAPPQPAARSPFSNSGREAMAFHQRLSPPSAADRLQEMAPARRRASGNVPPLSKVQNRATQQPLPTRLPAVSLVAAGQRILAIDTQDTVFFSEDGGNHWKTVAAAWGGRAVKVELGSAAPGPRRSSARLISQPAGAASGVMGGIAEAAPQFTSSTLTGRVQDPSGASIPGASVVVRSSAKVLSMVKTDGDGRYVVSDVAPGSYEVAVEAPGFETLKIPVTLTASQQSQANFLLSVGQLSQSVSITAAAKPNLSFAQKRSAAPSPSAPVRTEPPMPFEITTDSGERWTSTDGQTWTQR